MPGYSCGKRRVAVMQESPRIMSNDFAQSLKNMLARPWQARHAPGSGSERAPGARRRQN